MNKIKNLVISICIAFLLFQTGVSFADDFRSRPINLWPVFYYENDGYSNKLDFIWPIIKYESSPNSTSFNIIKHRFSQRV